MSTAAQFAADLAAILAADDSTTAVCGAATALVKVEYVALDDPDAHGFGVTAPRPARITLAAGALGAPVKGALVTLAGVAYRLHTTDTSDDGAAETWTLRKVGT